MGTELSVVICAHNPRHDYLRRVMDALKAQILPKDRWELLVVDNASKESLDGKYDLTWHPKARCIRENHLGLTPARLRGIREAQADVLVFVDDDNLLASDYLEQAGLVSREWPRLGAWGGTCKPEFEEQPSAGLARRVEYLAIRIVEREMWCNFINDYRAVPFGAGLCVRRRVAEAYLGAVQKDHGRFSLDRKGTSLVSGGDMDLALVAHDLGLGTGLFPQLILTHLIPARRVQRDYMIELCESLAYSEYRLRRLRKTVETVAKSEFSILAEIKHRLKLCCMKPLDRGFASAYRRGRKRAEAEVHRLGGEASA